MNAITQTVASEPYTPPAHDMPRAIPVLAAVPEGCFSFAVGDDRTDPHIRAGDTAVIDPSDCKPRAGDLFLIEWQGHKGPIRAVVEAYKSSFCKSTKTEDFLWFVRDCNNPRSWSEYLERSQQGRRVSAADGPYTDEQLEKKLVGRVVGILQWDRPIKGVDVRVMLEATLCLKVIGDDVWPGVFPGDTVMINQNQKTPIEGNLFALPVKCDADGETKAMVIQTRRMPGGWAVCTPEDHYGPVTEDDIAEVVSGRVVGVLNKIQ